MIDFKAAFTESYVRVLADPHAFFDAFYNEFIGASDVVRRLFADTDLGLASRGDVMRVSLGAISSPQNHAAGGRQMCLSWLSLCSASSWAYLEGESRDRLRKLVCVPAAVQRGARQRPGLAHRCLGGSWALCRRPRSPAASCSMMHPGRLEAPLT